MTPLHKRIGTLVLSGLATLCATTGCATSAHLEKGSKSQDTSSEQLDTVALDQNCLQRGLRTPGTKVSCAKGSSFQFFQHGGSGEIVGVDYADRNFQHAWRQDLEPESNPVHIMRNPGGFVTFQVRDAQNQIGVIQCKEEASWSCQTGSEFHNVIIQEEGGYSFRDLAVCIPHEWSDRKIKNITDYIALQKSLREMIEKGRMPANVLFQCTGSESAKNQENGARGI